MTVLVPLLPTAAVAGAALSRMTPLLRQGTLTSVRRSRPATRMGIGSSITRLPKHAAAAGCHVVPEQRLQCVRIGAREDEAFLGLPEVQDRRGPEALLGLRVDVFDNDLVDGQAAGAHASHADPCRWSAFNQRSKSQHSSSSGVRDEASTELLEKRRVQAGLRRLTWHALRRTFAGNLLDNGNDLVTVQKLMGHASPTTTAGYDRRGEEVKRRASRSLHVPYLN
jgi:hypothetical protein